MEGTNARKGRTFCIEPPFGLHLHWFYTWCECQGPEGSVRSVHSLKRHGLGHASWLWEFPVCRRPFAYIEMNVNQWDNMVKVRRTSSGCIVHEDQWRILPSCVCIRKKYQTMPRMRGHLCLMDPTWRRYRVNGSVGWNESKCCATHNHPVLQSTRRVLQKWDLLSLLWEYRYAIRINHTVKKCAQENIDEQDGYLDKARVCHDCFELDRVDKRLSKGNIFDTRIIKTVHVVPNWKQQLDI